MAQQTNPLEPIFSYSIPGAHLLQISIVKQAAEETYKKQYFCFITLIAGENVQGGGRTFNFNNRLTMKVDCDKILALGHAIKAYVGGREAAIGPYSIYVDSSKSQFGSGGGKSMLLQKGVDQKHNNPMVNLFFKAGSNQALAFSLNPAHALALADICDFIGKKCLELEFMKIQVNAHSGVMPNKVGSPPMSPPKSVNAPNVSESPFNMNQTSTPNFQNSPEQVLNNFAGGFENLPQFDDSPF